FFFRFYRPSNAILVVAGNVTTERVRELCEKWFSDIAAGEKWERSVPQEPPQNAPRQLEVKADVPLNSLYKTWHIASRLDDRYYVADLLTDILSGGGSSRLYHSLVRQKRLFINIECYHFGSIDKGLLAIEGKLAKGVSMQEAESAVQEELNKVRLELVPEAELQKVKNKTESTIAFEDMSVMNRANSLAYYELLGDANLMNEELEKYNRVTTEDIRREAQEIFRDENCSTLYYYSNTQQ
ncbi:MAG TPA: insulinase family protein, partial [Chitinophagaceae bacterium]